MSNHTEEPWHVQSRTFISNKDYMAICRLSDPVVMNGFTGKTEYAGPRDRDTILEANAKRIVECVNAMQGIEDPEKFMKTMKKFIEYADCMCQTEDRCYKHEALALFPKQDKQSTNFGEDAF